MSHLIIEQGKDVGTEVTVPEKGMKFGRSPANDLVLEDDAVMLFHGRFFFKSDGSLWVTDFGAGEKTTVGGIPVDEHPLQMGDLVEVGGTAFRIINTSVESEAEAATVVKPEKLKPAEAQELPIDLGFKRAARKAAPVVDTRPPAKSNLLHRLVMAVATLVVIVVAVLVFNSLSNKLGSGSAGNKKQRPLVLTYERVEGDASNIVRYYLELDVTGKLSINVDDLVNNRHIQDSEMVSASAVQQLARSIEDSGFYQLSSDYAAVDKEQYDLYDLSVQHNGLFHHIKVLNRTPPSEMNRAKSAIEDFALSELRISTTLFKDPEELMSEATHAFAVGEERFAERDVRNANLARAIKQYEDVMLLLQTFEPKPELYEQAERRLEEAKVEQDKRYDAYIFQVERSMQLQEWEEAQRYLHILIELINREDERYDDVESKLNTVEQRLR